MLLMAIQMYTIDWQNAKQTKSRLFHYITLMLPDVAKKSIWVNDLGITYMLEYKWFMWQTENIKCNLNKVWICTLKFFAT